VEAIAPTVSTGERDAARPLAAPAWRHRLLDGLLGVFAVVSLPLLVNEALYREDWWAAAAAWTVLPLLLVLRGRLSFTLRAGALTVMLLLLGVWATATAGLMSSGRIFLGAAVIVGALLLGRRMGIALFVLGALATALVGYCAVAGVLRFAAPFDTAANSAALWGSFFGSFVIGVGVLLMSVLYVIETLERLHGELRDEIREREASQRAEQEAARHLRFLADSASDTLWTADLDLNYTYISDSIKRLRGYTPEEARALGVAGALSADTGIDVRALLQRALRQDPRDGRTRPLRLETRLTTKDGSGIDAEINLSFIRDDAGEPIGIMGVTRDVSERKRLEAAMDSVLKGTRPIAGTDFFDALTENLATVLEMHAVLIGTLENDHTVRCLSVYQDGAHVPNFSYRLPGTPCETALSGSLCCIESNVQARYPDDELLQSMGVEGYVGMPLADADGEPVGILAALHNRPLANPRLAGDLLTIFGAHASLELSRQRAETERESIRLQLEQAQKLESIGQLSGGIAHDFNNLLVVMQGYAELAALRVEGDSVLQNCIDNIRESTNRAAALTRQLLSFSRRQVMDTRPIALNELLENLSGMLERLLPEDIDYEHRLDPALGTIEADPGQLEQAVMNLAVNARDAMPRGGALTVETQAVTVSEQLARTHPGTRPGRFARLRVADSGEGMSEAVRAQVFEPFFTTKPEGLGTGLGMSVVFGIVKQHGGFIELRSAPGQGTEVDLYLPLVERAAQPPAPKPAPQPQRGTETILLVEDEPEVRRLATLFLYEAGYTVIEAADGAAAVAAFARHRDEIALAILDVVLPKSNGREVMAQITGLAPGLKVLFVSGYAAAGIHTDFILEDDLELLPKPYSRDALLGKVRELLDGP